MGLLLAEIYGECDNFGLNPNSMESDKNKLNIYVQTLLRELQKNRDLY